MEYFEAFVLGLVQGITEFLPISSTAHLLIFTKVLGWQALGEKTFVNAIQLGSVFAVLIYFWQDIRQIVGKGLVAFQQKDWQKEEWKILLGITIGTVPALVGGFVLKVLLHTDIESSLVIAIASILLALTLGAAERWGSRTKTMEELEVRDGVLVGLGQMLALVPGVSRSGATLSTGLFLGLERDAAAKFSFLLGIPTLTIVTAYESYKVFKELKTFAPLLVGIISAFIFSYLTIAWLLKFLRTQSTWVFVWYRLAFGGAILGAIASGNFS
jgi:undecaprenyl-diphosphatase